MQVDGSSLSILMYSSGYELLSCAIGIIEVVVVIIIIIMVKISIGDVAGECQSFCLVTIIFLFGSAARFEAGPKRPFIFILVLF